MKIKSVLFILCFFTVLFMYVGCASIPEEQKSDTYEVEAYEIYIAPTAAWKERFKSQYIYVVYEKDVKLAKKIAKPVFVDKWEKRTTSEQRLFLNIKSSKEEAYAKSFGQLDESYILGTNVSGPKKYFINIIDIYKTDIYKTDIAFSKLIKGMFNVGKNDRFYAVRLIVDNKENYAGEIFTYDYIESVGNSKKGSRFLHIYTNDEACFKIFKRFESSIGCYTEKLR